MSGSGRSMTLFTIPGIPEVQPGDNLTSVIIDSIRSANIVLKSKDILVVAQKIVSKAEGRYISLDTITPSEHALLLAKQTDKDPRIVEVILRQANEVVRCRPGLIVVEHVLGFVMANAGIDRSNVPGNEDRVLLLPEDPDHSAKQIAESIESELGCQVAVVIADSVGRAWRVGTIGTAIGLHGIKGLVDLRGKLDREGRVLEVSQVGLADEIASAASLLLGEGDEGTPVVVLRGLRAPESTSEVGPGIQSLLRDKSADMFR